MKRFVSMSVALALVALVAQVRGEDVKSGPQPGDKIGAFNVVKVAGAADDGVDVGQELCYRCKYGTRPMVMVFSRNSDDSLAAAVKQLDQAVAAGADKDLKVFVNIMGTDRDALEKQAKAFADSTAVKNVPIVVPVEFENGPGNYGINPDATVTVIVASAGKVVNSHAVDKLDDATVKTIIAELNAAAGS